jgi:hypothetical protein
MWCSACSFTSCCLSGFVSCCLSGLVIFVSYLVVRKEDCEAVGCDVERSVPQDIDLFVCNKEELAKIQAGGDGEEIIAQVSFVIHYHLCIIPCLG